MTTSAGLFGLVHSNHDFSKPANWGKNIFNNAFPTALACYMASQNIDLVYYTLDSHSQIKHGYISVEDCFGITYDDPEIFFAFETDFAPFRSMVDGTLPRADLIISRRDDGSAIRPLEIKLTALPDNSTYRRTDALYGSEIVVRPDTIVYIALSIAQEYIHHRDTLKQQLSTLPDVSNWANRSEVLPHIPAIAATLDTLMQSSLHRQKPIIMQPIWKTRGKQLSLHENAFDVFAWSDFAFTRLFFRDAVNYVDSNRKTITRGARSIIWLARMLQNFADNGRIAAQRIVDSVTLGTKNDKAFAVNGRVTQPFMACNELTTPRINRQAVREIILGGGENYLSPERRLDAAIAGTPELFED